MLSKKQNSKSRSNEKGQLTIFMGIAVTIVFGCLAFIINVGLFVKAKINLQNAVDAAAWAGAAAQARQLTGIAHLNWEVRNVFKEWMFKYYIVGQLANNNTTTNRKDPIIDFRPRSLTATEGNFAYDANAYSRFNAPTICIHFDSDAFNVCGVAASPGLPRFGDIGMVGIAESQKNFVNDMVSKKSRDCTRRTDLNFGTAMIWAYGSGGTESGIQSNAPKIAAHRMGAWPKALELALRIRNLEYIVNRPPVSSPICIGSGSGCISVSTLSSTTPDNPLNERPVKAFMSAHRNLSGGYDGESDDNFRDLKNTFKLTELAPNPMDLSGNTGTLSTYFINEVTYPGEGTSAKKKHYLDLQLQMVNYLTFYTAFVASNALYGAGGGGTGVASEGSCASSIVGMPVPGYILGFTKNPDVLTYYAVKGEAKFTGLFYPFSNKEAEGITLRAYAAAKPFGGRIDPRLFRTTGNPPKGLKPRTDEKRSYPYLMGINTGKSSPATYIPGYPIPFYSDFYVLNSDDNVGGIPEGSETPSFGIPSLIYEYVGDMTIHKSDILMTVEEIVSESKFSNDLTDAALNVKDVGLFDKVQFEELAGALGGASGNITSAQINDGLLLARKPTIYEALNYLIPTHHTGTTIESLPIVTGIEQQGASNSTLKYMSWSTYAPLVHEQFLFTTYDDIQTVVRDFVFANKNAFAAFTFALAEVARSMKVQGQQNAAGPLATSPESYDAAADALFPDLNCNDSGTCTGGRGCTTNTSPGCLTMHNGLSATPEACAEESLASKFAYFFDTTNSVATAVCGIIPIHFNVAAAYTALGSTDPNYLLYYTSEYTLPLSPIVAENLMTAYMPGTRQGADDEGKLTHPFSNNALGLARRNSYSTKHIGIKRLASAAGSDTYLPNIAYAENDDIGNDAAIESSNDSGFQFTNYLAPSQLSEFGTDLYY